MESFRNNILVNQAALEEVLNESYQLKTFHMAMVDKRNRAEFQ